MKTIHRNNDTVSECHIYWWYIGQFAAIVLAFSQLFGCANGPVYPNSPIAVVGSDFTADAAAAIRAYADYKGGNVNMTWALQQAFNAYALSAKTAADVKALVNAWAGGNVDAQKLADRLAHIFNASSAPPEQKIAAFAVVAQHVASDKSP